jgi:hypothetical protein
MKRYLLPLCFLLAVVPSQAQSTRAGVPTYLNAEIVNVDRAEGSATLRSESGDIVLTADAHAFAGLVGLRSGDKVVVAYETVIDETGRSRRIVTYAQPASPTSGEPGSSVAAASGSSPSFGSTVRVLSIDRANRRITVTDTSGTPVALRVSSRAGSFLADISAGDVVGLNFTNGGVVTAEVLPSVSAIQALPAGTSVGGFVLPPFNGQFVRFDANRNMLTVQTQSGQLRTFPVSNTLGPSLSGLRTGSNLSLNFQVAQAGARGSATAVGPANLAGGVPPIMSVNNVQTLPPGFVQQRTNSFATVPGGGAAPLSAQGMTATNAGIGQAGLTASGAGMASSQGMGSPAAGGMAGFSQPGFATAAPFLGGAGIAGPASPFSTQVPSIPTPTATYNAVLPPAVAKTPLSEDEVGMMRAWAERDLDSAAMVLASAANEIDGQWFRYKNLCLGGFTPETSWGREWFLVLEGRVRTLTTDDQCRQMYTSLLGAATGWEQQLGIVLDAARRADVLPGRIRETLARHRIDP